MSYNVYFETVGYLEKTRIKMVSMPRADFVAAVEECIEDWTRFGDGESAALLRRELLPVAATMERFPFGQWIATSRGCGCLVGEYLIAQPEMDRAMMRDNVGNAPENIRAELNKRLGKEDSDVMFSFGNEIDRFLKHYLAERKHIKMDYSGIAAIDIED